MKINRKHLSIVLSVVLMLSILFGCASGGNSSTIPNSTSETPKENPSSAAVAGNEEKIDLSFMCWQPTLGMLNDEMLPAVAEKYPNINISVQVLDWFAFWDKLTVELAAGGGPDFMSLDVDHISTYYDYIQPLDNLAAEVIGSDWVSKFNDGVIDGLKIADDTTRMMPMDVTGLWYLFYNKTLCDELGVEPPTGEYANLIDFVNKVNAANSSVLPVAFAGKEDVNVGFFWQWLVNNNEYAAIQKAVAGEAKFTDEPFAKAMTQILDMQAKGILDEKVFGLDAYPGADDAFKGRNCVAYLTGEWYLGGYLMGSQMAGTAAENDELGIIVLKNVEGNELIMQRFAAFGYAINNNCKYPKETMQIIEDWTLGKGAQAWENYQACLPAAKDVKLDLNLMKSEEAKKTVGPALDVMASSRSTLRSTLNSALDNKIGELVVSVLRMGMDPKDALMQMQQAAESIQE